MSNAPFHHCLPLYFASRLTGKSMRPFLSPGNILLVSRKNISPLRVGDLVLYYDDTTLVCHRVYAIKNNQYHIKPDVGLKPDKTLFYHEIAGKVIAIQKKNSLLQCDTSLWFFWNKIISRLSLMTTVLYIIKGRIEKICRLNTR